MKTFVAEKRTFVLANELRLKCLHEQKRDKLKCEALITLFRRTDTPKKIGECLDYLLVGVRRARCSVSLLPAHQKLLHNISGNEKK
jgi:hypothetical protein